MEVKANWGGDVDEREGLGNRASRMKGPEYTEAKVEC